MAAETKTYVLGNEGASNSMLPLMANGGFGGLGGWGGLLLGWLFGMGWGGFGGYGGWGGNAGAGDATRDLVMQGLAGNRESIAAIASSLNTDFNSIQSALSAINTSLANVGAQVGMSGLQVVNAIQSGDAQLSRQLCECCCENRLLTTQSGYENRIQTIEQTNQLGSQADRNTRSITDAIAAQTTLITKEFCDLKERELQDKIDSLTAANTILKSQIDNAAQTAAIESYVANLVNPVISDVSAIKAAQPATVTVQYPQLSAVPTAQLYGYQPYSYTNGNGYWY